MELDVDYLPHIDGNRVLHGRARGKALTFGFTAKGFTVGSGIRLQAPGRFMDAMAQLAETGSIHLPTK